MAQTWIVRAGREDEYEQEALEQNVVAMGWQRLGDLTQHRTQRAIKTLVDSAFAEFSSRSRTETTVQVFAFRSTMKIGDFVILLRSDAPTVAIGTVTGDYEHRPQLPAPHVRSVRWLRTDVTTNEIGTDLLTVPALTSIYQVRVAGAEDRLLTVSETTRGTCPRTTPAATPTAAPVTALDNFHRNLEYALNLSQLLVSTYSSYRVQAFEVSDVFRAAWVQTVSALDHWVHEEMRERMLATAAKPTAEATRHFQRFQLPITLVEQVAEQRLTVRDAVGQHWSEAFGRATYQQPDDIRDAFAYVTDVKQLWQRVAAVLNERASDGTVYTGDGLQTQLKDVVHRRNKIAHEYDEDPDNRPAKRPIDAASTTRAIRLIEQLAEALVVVLNGRS